MNIRPLTFCLLSISMLAISSFAQDRSLPSKVSVLESSLVIKENSGSPEKGFIAEYIPESETFDNWTVMFATRYVNGSQDPKAAAQNTVTNIKRRREKGDIFANAMALEAPDKKSMVVDFLISQNGVLEHNIWRYYPGSRGLKSMQIARRLYQKSGEENATTEFVASVKTLRTKLLNEIMRQDLPQIGASTEK